MMPNPVEAVLGPAWVGALGFGLLHSLWQGAVIAGATAGALLLLRRSSAASRYAVAYSGMCLMFVLPVAAVWLRYSSFPGSAPLVPPAVLLAGVLTPAAAAALFPWLVSVWLIGVAALALRLLGGWVVARRMSVAGVQPLSERWQETAIRLSKRLRLSRPVSVVESTLAEVPSVVGCVRPVILIPVSALTGLAPEHLEAILAHELAHVRRHDYLMNLVQTAVETLLFYHPAVWWISRRVRVERENCCDDLAVLAWGDPVEYASALTELERLRSVHWQPAMSAAGGHLLGRVRRLTVASQTERGVRAWAAVAVLCLGSAVVVLSVQSASAPLAFQPPGTAGPGLSSSVLSPLSLPPATVLVGTLLGILLGMRHAFEPDHLAAISTLVTAERSALKAAWLGTSWGVGHTGALLAVGAGLAIVQASMPLRMAEALELSVAVMSIALGIRALRAGLLQGSRGPDAVHTHGARIHRHAGAMDHVHVGCWTLARRPLLVGVVHGLAGSGALTALAMASLPSASARVAFIVLFGFGSTISMALVSGCAGWPMARLQRDPRMLAVLSGATGLASIGFGLVIGSPLVWGWLFS